MAILVAIGDKDEESILRSDFPFDRVLCGIPMQRACYWWRHCLPLAMAMLVAIGDKDEKSILGCNPLGVQEPVLQTNRIGFLESNTRIGRLELVSAKNRFSAPALESQEFIFISEDSNRSIPV